MARLPAVPDSNKPRILILGGTGEAADLARSLVGDYGDRLEVLTSLAGRTHAPAELPGRVRRGGFGGAGPLADYLKDHKIAAVIDATHPFAAQISANAVSACAIAGVPRLVLSRPCWTPKSGDNWSYFDTVKVAAQALPQFGRRAFLTIGMQELAPFWDLPGMWLLVRLIELPLDPLPVANVETIAARGPFSVAGERMVMESHKIDVLVTKSSGGAATAAKLTAARQLGLPVVMISRPPAPKGPSVNGIQAVIDWIIGRLGS